MTDTPPVRAFEPVDWEFAETVSHRVAGHDPLGDSYHRRSLEQDFSDATAKAADLVADFTGLTPSVDVAAGRVVSRQEWATLNLRSFRTLLDPVTERLGERVGRSPAMRIGRRVAGAEAGALLGWFGRRVLGQYDLFDGGADPDGVGSVYYVGPNVLALESRHGFPPRAFRLWIALHEVTHLVQFTGVPWMREYFLGLIDESLQALDPDPARLVRALGEVLEKLRAGKNPLDDGGLVSLLASPEQREILGRIQALMSLLEGHGNYVMDRLGADHVEGKDHMAAVLRERRNARGVSRQVQRAMGVELKLRQYSVGESFFDAVEEAAGTTALEALWAGPESLPTLSELGDARRWVERVGAAVRP